MQLITRARASDAVLAVRQAYLARPFARAGIPMCLFELNNGSCDDFARDLVSALGFDPCHASEADGLMLVETSCFQVEHDDGALRWDQALLCKHWGIAKPVGTTWTQLNDIDWGHHVWLAARVDSRWMHFDAECVEGAGSFFELPLFRRHIENRWPSEREVRNAPSDHIF